MSLVLDDNESLVLDDNDLPRLSSSYVVLIFRLPKRKW